MKKALRRCSPLSTVEVHQSPSRCRWFYEWCHPLRGKISAKDETFLLEEIENIEFLKELDIKSYWVSMSTNTKDATWQYLQTLYMLGTTITSLPDDTLSQIEKIAKGVAAKMQDGDGELDQDALMKMMGSMLGGLPKK